MSILQSRQIVYLADGLLFELATDLGFGRCRLGERLEGVIDGQFVEGASAC